MKNSYIFPVIFWNFYGIIIFVKLAMGIAVFLRLTISRQERRGIQNVNGGHKSGEGYGKP